MEFAKSLATYAGRVFLENFDKDLAVEIKADSSPVTEIDKHINEYVIEQITRKFPGHAVLGEEKTVGTGSEKYQWICDPLDGTKPYILGVPNSVFMLALAKDTVIQLAVVYDPFAGRMYTSIRGEGAYCNDRQIHVSTQEIEDGYILLGAATSTELLRSIKSVGGKYEAVSGSGYKSMMIARGKGIGYIKYGADYHDIAPASLIIEEAGGKVTGLKGESLDFTKTFNSAILSNGIAHDSLVEIAKSIDE